MQITIEPGKWTGLPQLIIEAMAEGENVVVKVKIGNIGFAHALPRDLDADDIRDVLLDCLVCEMAAFMMAHYRQLLMERAEDVVAAVDGEGV